MSDLDVKRDLQGIETFEDAFNMMEATLDANKVLGEGFTQVKDKTELIGVPFLILEWRFHTPQDGYGEFVIVKAITRDNVKVLFVDGSTGIREQLRELQETHGVAEGLICKKGLRVSNYEYEDESGEKKPATTYYIDEG